MSKLTGNISYETALLKACRYCAYQERYQSQVVAKLIEWKVELTDIDKILLYLMEHNYLSEGRFAQVYVSGKVRIKHWGFQKIKFELKRKGLTDMAIKLAIQAFDDHEYLTILNGEIKKQMDKWKKLPAWMQSQKLKQTLLSKGFSSDDISNALNLI